MEPTPVKITKRTPEEALQYQSLKLVEAMKHIRAFRYARWAMFGRQELRYLAKGMEAVVLQLGTQNFTEAFIEAQTLLTAITEYLNDHDRPDISPNTATGGHDSPPRSGE